MNNNAESAQFHPFIPQQRQFPQQKPSRNFDKNRVIDTPTVLLNIDMT